VAELTSGRFRITAAPAGELTSPVGILDAVNSSEFSIGSTASYYYVEQSPVLAFATAVPFGLSMRQHVSWLYYGGGLQLLQQHFADNFNVIQFPAGNTGAQMGGWFTNEVNSLSDLEGLRMRIPGLGGQVMQRLGVEVVSLGAGDITAALSAGEIDAAEFVGPYDDSRLGLQDSAGFYYYPGFWEPGASFDLMINLDAWNALPPLYQAAVRSAAFESVVRVTAEYDARNGQALNELVSAGTELREFPADILQAGEAASGLLLDELAAGDAEFSEVLDQWRAFRRQITPWFSLAQSGL
jgi:TRAP-type mannitol/chloroaromatic compound transport system substrate-binding protein